MEKNFCRLDLLLALRLLRIAAEDHLDGGDLPVEEEVDRNLAIAEEVTVATVPVMLLALPNIALLRIQIPLSCFRWPLALQILHPFI